MKKVFLFIVSVFAVSAAAAQDDISKQMEVTKAYTPKVGQAAKLSIEPRMTDTVRLRPDIEYSITPTAWRTSFSSEKYSPARMNVAPFEKNRPFYVRAGVGYPFQTTGDLYFNPYMGSSSTFGLFFNHRGSYSKIENEMGVKPNSAEMLNGGGLYGSRFFRRYKLSGDFEYDNRLHNAYGVAPPDLFDFPGNDPAVVSTSFAEADAFALGRLRGQVVFGDTFADLSRFNFQAGLNAGAAHATNSSFYQFDLDVWARIAKMFNPKHGLEVGLYERGALGMGDLADVNAVAVMFRPQYLLSLKKFSLRAGIDMNYVKNDAYLQNYLSFLPRLEMQLNIAKGYFTPYMNFTSDMQDGSFEALSRQNPYNRSVGATGWTHDLRLGFSGSAGNVFSYRLFGGVSILSDYNVLFGFQEIVSDGSGNAVFSPMYFLPEWDNGFRYVLGTELGLSNLGGFSAGFAVNWYREEMNDLPAGEMPAYDLSLKLAYSHRDKFTVSAGTKVTGNRDCINAGVYYDNTGTIMQVDAAVNTIPAAADVFAGVEVKLFDGLNVFVEGRNLANRRLYPYQYYRGLGANVIAGIKAVF